MNVIDSIQINFSPDSLTLLNICLAFLMFGVALDIKISDFKRILESPKIPLVGLFSEYVYLPLLTLGLIFIIKPQASLALGMILISVCPGGSVSNYMVHLSKGNSALSVLLTSITTVGAILITPFAFKFWSSFVGYADELLTQINVDAGEIVVTVVQLILIPVFLGMFINHRFSAFAQRIKKSVSRFSMLIFLSFVFFGILSNFENIKDYLSIVFVIVLVHNGLALLGGYGIPKFFGVEEKDCRAISIETGIQNSGLGLVLVFNFFDGLGGMALILAWWGIWHLLTGFLLSFFWRRRPSEASKASEI